MFKYIAFLVGQWLVNVLPIRLSYFIAEVVASCMHPFQRQDKVALYHNLSIINGRPPSHKEIKAVHLNFARYLVEFFLVGQKFDATFIQERVDITGLDHIKKVQINQSGGIFLTAHIGNWELGGVMLNHIGFPTTVVALPHKEKKVNDFFNKRRSQHQLKVIPTHAAVKGCLQTLRKKGYVALVADRDFSGHGLDVEMFGQRVSVPKGPALLSLRTGCPIIPAFLIRIKSGYFQMMVEKPIYPFKIERGDRITDEYLQKLLQEYMDVVAKYIHKFPDQWLIFRQFNQI